MDAGAMCMPGSVEKVQRLVDDAMAKGAKLLAGGKPGAASGTGGAHSSTNGRSSAAGQFYPPTVLAGVTKSMAIYREEVFGPVSREGRVRGRAGGGICAAQLKKA